jgi:hypothetical protein
MLFLFLDLTINQFIISSIKPNTCFKARLAGVCRLKRIIALSRKTEKVTKKVSVRIYLFFAGDLKGCKSPLFRGNIIESTPKSKSAPKSSPRRGLPQIADF